MRLITMLLLSPAVFGLSDAEIALFGVRSCSVTYGASGGATLTASITATKDAAADTLSIVTSGIPDHATCDPATTSSGATCYNDPISTYFSDQGVSKTVPLTPSVASSATGLNAGTIGYAVSAAA